MKKRIGTIHAPEKPVEIPLDSQWLFGQGAGAWFSIKKTAQNNSYTIKRFAANGDLDCDRVFELAANSSSFDIEKQYEFIHLSHCSKSRIKQNNIIFIFNYKGE
jgi:hypothetical protein